MKEILYRATKKYSEGFSGLPNNCWSGIILSFINTITSGVCFYFSLYFVNILHFNIVTASVLISFFGFGNVVGGILGGKLSDYLSTTKICFFSLLIKAVGFLILAKFNSFTLLAINVFFLGLVSYSFKTANSLLVLHHCESYQVEKLKAINILYTLNNLGIGVAALFISILAHYTFEVVFTLCGILLITSAAYLIIEHRVLSINNTNVVPTTDNRVNNKGNIKAVSLVLLCVFLVGLIIVQRRATYPIFLHHTFPNLGIHGVSLLLGLNPLLIVLFQSPFVACFDRVDKLTMVGIGSIMMGVGLWMLAWSPLFTLAILACVIYTFGEMLFFAMAQWIIYHESSEKRKGQVMGLFQMFYATSTVIGPGLGGYIFHYYGSNYLWSACGFIGVFCFLACLGCKSVSLAVES